MLCTEGFDLQAKAILRTFLETLLTCILILRDEDIRNKYKNAQDVNDAYLFWRNNMKEKNLVKDIHDLFVEYGLEEAHIKGITDWVNDEFRVTSQAVHPSFAAATMATYPIPLTGDTFHPGILGVPTSLSYETLSATSKFLWLFSKVSMKLLLEPPKGKRRPMFKLIKGSESSKLMAVSFSIYDEFVVSYWGEDKATSSETAEN